MATIVGIVNRALDELGATPIVALTEGSSNANLASRNYDQVRDAVLRAHPWNFASARLKLARLATAPVSGFNYAYQLPADFIRVIAVWDNDGDVGTVRYRLEGDKRLLSDAEEIYLKYVQRITDPNAMSADFRDAVSLRLAVAMSLAITNSRQIREELSTASRRQEMAARSVDSIEDYPEEFPADTWVTERDQ